ncbi:hypothetical protein HII31_05454 [Pseudocercospora fuligena]|uniref:BTB domain-containing protein n=1 Tax=Pseudocercospora fuligena TaxID=685502 RepID=A0A8H6VI31_9PEZI|nr:hypothetical protein HII31_05454 [Pseudocercospora fuligena]
MAVAPSRDVRYADMIVVCGDRSWEVHSNFVCPRAAVFENAFDRNNPNMVVDLSRENEQVVAATIEFIYDGHYNAAESASDDNISLHADVLRFASQHNIQDLRRYALGRYSRSLAGDWHRASFADTLNNLYSSTREDSVGLRSAATAVAMTHARQLLGDPSRYARFNQVMARHPSLAIILAQSLARALNEFQNSRNSASQDVRLPFRPQHPRPACGRRLKCPRCNEDFEAELPSSGTYQHQCDTERYQHEGISNRYTPSQWCMYYCGEGAVRNPDA